MSQLTNSDLTLNGGHVTIEDSTFNVDGKDVNIPSGVYTKNLSTKNEENMNLTKEFVGMKISKDAHVKLSGATIKVKSNNNGNSVMINGNNSVTMNGKNVDIPSGVYTNTIDIPWGITYNI